MILRTAIAAIAGGIVFFMVSALSWMALPFHGDSLHTPPLPAEQVDALLTDLPRSGAYHWPGFPDDPSDESAMNAMFERMESGPNIALMIVHQEGATPFSPVQFAGKLALDVGSAGLAALLLLAGPARRPFAVRSGFVAAFGVVVALSGLGPEWLWWGFPPEFALPTLADILVGWGLVGLVVGGIVRRMPRLDRGRPSNSESLQPPS